MFSAFPRFLMQDIKTEIGLARSKLHIYMYYTSNKKDSKN